MDIAVAVLYVYRATKRNDGTEANVGLKPMVCFRGKKHMLGILVDYPVRVIRRRAEEFDRCRAVPVPLKFAEEKVYPISNAVELLKEIVATHGSTDGAKKLIALAERVGKGATITEDDLQENVFTDEESIPSGYSPGVRTDGFVADPEAAKPPEGETPQEARKRARRAGPVTTTVANGEPVEEGAQAQTQAQAHAPAGRKRVRGAESPMKLAVEYMRTEIIAIGGLQEVTKEWRAELFKRAAEKFGISPNTCGVQWGRTLLPSMGAGKAAKPTAPAAKPASAAKPATQGTDPAAARTAAKPKAAVPSSPEGAAAGAQDVNKRRAPVRGAASPMNQAIAYMLEEVANLGGLAKVTKEWRRELFARAAQKFGISPNTCNVQWGKKIAKK